MHVTFDDQFPDVALISPEVYADKRGEFLVSYSEEDFKKEVCKVNFVQDNISKSACGVIRGLHYQVGDYTQGKLVWVICGMVQDVIVDIRKDSPTFGQHKFFELTDIKSRMLWIPPGYAHGFCSLADATIFAYKVTADWDPASERCIRYDDPTLNIAWAQKDLLIPTVVSDKDLAGMLFTEAPYL